MRKIIKKVSAILVLTMMMSLAACGKKTQEEVLKDAPVEQISIIGDISENTLKMSPNGSILEISVEDFSNMKVNTDELQKFVNEEVENYNVANGGNKITVQEFRQDADTVKTAIQYSDIDTYNSFNNLDIVFGLYDSDVPDEIARVEYASANDAIVAVDTEDINVEELAEAGYSLDDLEALQGTAAATDTDAIEDVYASLTDASTSELVGSGDISGSGLMMLVTDRPVNFIINSGKVLYVNNHATVTSDNSAKTLGDGKAVVVFTYEF